jgi:prepilin signal peptidase PulO-like enzyme (type II secretory pathway)
MRYALPFGTFLGVGAILVMFFGDPVLDWYKGLFHG